MTNSQADYIIILSKETFARIENYAAVLKAGGRCGVNLGKTLKGKSLDTLDTWQLLSALLNSKQPQIFAESFVVGDGSDWTLKELSLLGDISIGMKVTTFDNGAHQAPVVHTTPFTGHLVYTPGALLRNDQGRMPADWLAVTQGGEYNRDKYYQLYERRLLPAFKYINKRAIETGHHAFITIPGIGCGQFAGPFKGQMGHLLQAALVRLLNMHGEQFQAIKAVYYDPYNECINDNKNIHGIQFITRPLIDNFGKSQLCKPEVLGHDSAGNFKDCELYSFVAWDHVSWPGNDYYLGDRVTDDGVKAAATNTMQRMTGIEGHYCSKANKYFPPKSYTHWEEVVIQNNLEIVIADNHYIV